MLLRLRKDVIFCCWLLHSVIFFFIHLFAVLLVDIVFISQIRIYFKCNFFPWTWQKKIEQTTILFRSHILHYFE